MSQRDIDLIAQEISPEVAAAIVRAFGGQLIYVPRVPPPDHPLSVALGHEKAKKVAKLLGAGHLDMPTGARAETDRNRARIEAMLDAGRSHSEIVRAVGCSTRTVTRHAARLRSARPRRAASQS